MFDYHFPTRPLHRRQALTIGALGLLGWDWCDLDQLRAEAGAEGADARHRQNACIFVFLFGGPSHIDLWDMKPAAPVEIRGEFQPAATVVPGIQLCEHLPKLAQQMDKLCLLRSMTHSMNVHGPACSEIYSGREYFGPPVTDQARPEDWPSLASLVMRYGTSAAGLPPSVVVPWYSQFSGQSERIAGQTGGRMGATFDPVLIEGDPSEPAYDVPGLRFRDGIGTKRMAARRQLLQQLQAPQQQQALVTRQIEAYERRREMAYAMLHQRGFSEAFRLSAVPDQQRDLYGRTKFGQSLLLAKRLVGAGVPLVTVNWDDPTKHDKVSPFWDTHHDNFPKLKDQLCPLFDQSFSHFLADLDREGLLETTLVVALGEFGRTPRIGQFTQNNMTEKTGRDHWPHAFTALVAGGGVRGGQVYGATNRNGGYVADRPVSPADLSATILKHLGIDPHHEYFDRFQHLPRRLSIGKPVEGLG